LLTKQDISTTEKKQNREGIESKTDNEQGTKKKKKEEEERRRMIQSSWGLIVCSECLG
jgi:hypothetical protein